MHLASLALLFVCVVAHSLPGQTQFVVRSPAAVAATSLNEAAAADFDGDGDLDLCGGRGIFTPGPTVRLLRNDGSERFVDLSASLPALPPTVTSTRKTVPFDMDGDGDLDLFLIVNGTSLLWRNIGNLTFVDASANLPPHYGYFSDAVAADFDADGDVDIAASGSALAASFNVLFVNQGSGTFTLSGGLPGNTSNALAGADIDLDGDLDLVIGTFNSGLEVRRNDGNLVFTDVSATWVPAGVAGVALDVAAGDLDGDGRIDLVLARQNAGTDLVLRNTGSSFVVTGALATPFSGTKSTVLADVDEDGDLDLFRAAISGTITLAVNDGFGTLAVSATRLPPSSSMSPVLVGGDFDRDGDTDVLVCEIFVPALLLTNRHRDLRPGQPLVGQPWNIEIWSEPGYATLHHTARLAVGLAALPQPLLVPTFGELWLDLDAGYVFFEGVVLASAGEHTFSIPVPPLPQLVGLTLHLQGLAEQARGPARFTSYFPVTVQ